MAGRRNSTSNLTSSAHSAAFSVTSGSSDSYFEEIIELSSSGEELVEEEEYVEEEYVEEEIIEEIEYNEDDYQDEWESQLAGEDDDFGSYNTRAEPPPIRITVMGGSVTLGIQCKTGIPGHVYHDSTTKYCAWPHRLESFINDFFGVGQLVEVLLQPAPPPAGR